MLSPDEVIWIGSAKASLFCAVTPVRRVLVSTVPTGAERDSFSQGLWTTEMDFSRLWRGLEQTASKC
jgi:hypothetical protein